MDNSNKAIVKELGKMTANIKKSIQLDNQIIDKLNEIGNLLSGMKC